MGRTEEPIASLQEEHEIVCVNDDRRNLAFEKPFDYLTRNPRTKTQISRGSLGNNLMTSREVTERIESAAFTILERHN